MGIKLNILYQFNNAYAPYAGVSILSLFEQNKDAQEINVYILGEEIDDAQIERLKLTGSDYGRNVHFIDAKALISRVQEIGMPSYRGSYAANLRLFIPLILDDEIDRLLYLDADTIVNGDLQKLYQTDMGDKALGMVLDSLTYRHKKDIGLDLDEDYFNSGVILFRLDLWRKRDYTNRIVQHVLHVRSHYPSPDQDLLNVVCRNDIFRLPMQYNMQPIHQAFTEKSYQKRFGQKAYYSALEIKEAVKQPVIYHFFRFVGEFPWHKNSIHPNVKQFDDYLLRSRWKDYEKQAADVGMVLKIEKILYRCLPKSIFLGLFQLCHRLFTEKANQDSVHNKINKTI